MDFASGLIRVERSYDPTSGATTAPKSRAGVRKVPIPSNVPTRVAGGCLGFLPPDFGHVVMLSY